MMKQLKNNFIRVLGFAIFFGLCIFMLSGVNVKAAEKEPKFPDTCSVAIGEKKRLSVRNLEGRAVEFRSSDYSIVTVSNTGTLFGRNSGEAIITAVVRDNDSVVATLQCDVLVGPAAVSVRFTSKKLILKEGTAKKIYPLVIPKNTVQSPLYWSEDESIACISWVGTVSGLSVGSTNIHGEIPNGDSDVCRIVVLSADDYEDYRIGRRSLEDILSDMSNTDAQESNTTTEEEVTTAPDPGIVTPTPTVTPVAGVATAPVAGK